MILRISELKLLCQILIRHAQNNGYESIKPGVGGESSYWKIPIEDSYNFTEIPTPVAGFLSRDLSDLRTVACFERYAKFDDLDRLGNVFKIVSEYLYDRSKPWFMEGGNRLLRLKRRYERNVKNLEKGLKDFAYAPRLNDPVGILGRISPERRQIIVNRRLDDFVVQLRAFRFLIRMIDLLGKEKGL